MEIRTLYRTIREDGGVDVSINLPVDQDYTTLSRVIAGEGKILKNGDETAYCIDTENPNDWEEIDDENLEDDE